MTVMVRCILSSMLVVAVGCLDGRYRGGAADDDHVLPPFDVSSLAELPDGGPEGVVSDAPPSRYPKKPGRGGHDPDSPPPTVSEDGPIEDPRDHDRPLGDCIDEDDEDDEVDESGN